MKIILCGVLSVFLSFPAYAHTSRNQQSEAEMREVITLIALMQDFQNEKAGDLANFIECRIDDKLWSSHAILRDKDRHEKYTQGQIKELNRLHFTVLEKLQEYRENRPNARCVEK